jgi:hypothetical protein
LTFPFGVLAILGLIFSVISLRRVKRRGLSGFGMAVAGLCLSLVSLLFFVIFVIAVATETGEEDVFWEDLSVGECITDESVFTASVVSCQDRHGAEVYAVLDGRGRLPEQYPGRLQLTEPAGALCEPLFARALGVEPDGHSEFASRPVLPSELAWEHGERWIVCLVEREDGRPKQASVVRSNR